MWYAGQETTSGTLHFGMIFLARDVDVQSRMQAEIDAVVAEGENVTLRHRPHLPYTQAVVNVSC